MTEKKELNDDGVMLLTNAIIERACDDYRNAHHKIKELSGPDWIQILSKRHKKRLSNAAPENRQEIIETIRDRQLIGAEKTIREVENFFHSKMYTLLTSIDGDCILERLKNELQN